MFIVQSGCVRLLAGCLEHGRDSVAEVLAGPARTATTVLARFAFASKGFFEDYTEEEMPRLFADVSHLFSSYARLGISATEQAALKE